LIGQETTGWRRRKRRVLECRRARRRPGLCANSPSPESYGENGGVFGGFGHHTKHARNSWLLPELAPHHRCLSPRRHQPWPRRASNRGLEGIEVHDYQIDRSGIQASPSHPGLVWCAREDAPCTGRCRVLTLPPRISGSRDLGHIADRDSRPRRAVAVPPLATNSQPRPTKP